MSEEYSLKSESNRAASSGNCCNGNRQMGPADVSSEEDMDINWTCPILTRLQLTHQLNSLFWQDSSDFCSFEHFWQTDEIWPNRNNTQHADKHWRRLFLDPFWKGSKSPPRNPFKKKCTNVWAGWHSPLHTKIRAVLKKKKTTTKIQKLPSPVSFHI